MTTTNENSKAQWIPMEPQPEEPPQFNKIPPRWFVPGPHGKGVRRFLDPPYAVGDRIPSDLGTCPNCGGSGYTVEAGFPIDEYGNPTPIEEPCGTCEGEGHGIEWSEPIASIEPKQMEHIPGPGKLELMGRAHELTLDTWGWLVTFEEKETQA